MRSAGSWTSVTRCATATLSGPELRQLSGQRHRLVLALVRQARALARQAGYRVTEDVARGLEETLAAALTDPAVAEQLPDGPAHLRPDPDRLPSGLHGRRSSPASAPPVKRGPVAEAEQCRWCLASCALGRRAAPAAGDGPPAAGPARSREAGRAGRAGAGGDRRGVRGVPARAGGGRDGRGRPSSRAGAHRTTRDQVKRDSQRTQAADAKAAAEVQRAGQRVADLLARIETL